MAITWPQIGSLYFVSLVGDLDPAGQTLEPITRDAVDGVAYRELGERGDVSQLFGLAVVSSSSEAKTLIDNYKALQGTLQSIVMSEQTWTNYLILAVQCSAPEGVAGLVGGKFAGGTDITDGASGWQVASRWIVQYGGT